MLQQTMGKISIGAAFWVLLAAGPAVANAVSAPAPSVVSDQAIAHALGSEAARPVSGGQATAQSTSRFVTLNFGPFHFQETERNQAKACS